MLQYKIFQYAPIDSHVESITLGILFHESMTDHREFKYKSDLSQLETKCPEIDIEMIKKLLIGIKEQVEESVSFDIDDFTRFYLNDFNFGEIKYEEYGDLRATIDRIYKDYLLK